MPSLLRSPRLPGALAAVALLAAACSPGGADEASAADETRVFPADNGDITIPVEPERVVATGYAVPVLIEAEAPLVGISSWERGVPMMSEEHLAVYEDLDQVAGEQAAETNYEAIAEADPDLIIIGVPAPALGDIDVERLEGIAPVAAIGPTIPSAWRELSRLHADAAGALEEFDAVKEEYETRAAELAEKYEDVLPDLALGHIGSYGEVAAGNFQREFNESWGTNIAQDIGADYYGEVQEKGGGSRDFSEYPSIEELPEAFAEADAITYSVEHDGSIPEAVRYAMDSELWEGLPAVEDGQTYPIRYTEAATYAQALLALEAIDESFAPMLDR